MENLLNGKAKEDFIVFYLKDIEPISEEKPFEESRFRMQTELRKKYFATLDITCQHALIIEWLDSIGININVLNLDYQNWWYFKVKCIHPKTYYEEEMLTRTRQESTLKAIEKAVSIYNSRG